MRTLFEKFRASTALDRGEQPETSSKNQEVQRFANALREMGRELRESREKRAVPRGLHGSVMRAVRQSRPERAPAVSLRWLRPALATGLVLAGGLGVFMLASRPASDRLGGEPLAETPSLGVAFEHGHEMTQAVPKTVLGPLAGEMELLDGDIRNAVNFLVASVP